MTKAEVIAFMRKVWRESMKGSYAEEAYEMAIEALKERPKGMWMYQDHNKRHGMMTTCVYYMPTCSECGKTGDDQYRYCPHCGADMRGGEDE